jgi:predicted metal-dependent hydrolase
MYNIFRIVSKHKTKKRVNVNYELQKEKTRGVVINRLLHFNQYYNFKYNRIAIRDQKSRWGSCSSNANLNFNYRVGLLPEHLMDYVIVHELCHLTEMNHGPKFWELVSQVIPNYNARREELKKIDIRKM